MGLAKRRHASVWAMGHAAPKPIIFPDAQGAELLEGYNDLSVRWARRGYVSGGVFDHGTHEEDGPGTWEALASPRPIPASRRAGDRLRRTTRLQGHVSSATRHRTSTCIEVGHWQGEPEPWLMGAGRRRAAYER